MLDFSDKLPNKNLVSASNKIDRCPVQGGKLQTRSLEKQANLLLEVGSIAPDFTATDTDGVEHNLYDYLNNDKTVILNFREGMPVVHAWTMIVAMF